MGNFILMSIVLALLAVPSWAARDPSGPRGLKKTIVGIIAYSLLYLFLVRVVVPRLD